MSLPASEYTRRIPPDVLVRYDSVRSAVGRLADVLDVMRDTWLASPRWHSPPKMEQRTRRVEFPDAAPSQAYVYNQTYHVATVDGREIELASVQSYPEHGITWRRGGMCRCGHRQLVHEGVPDLNGRVLEYAECRADGGCLCGRYEYDHSPVTLTAEAMLPRHEGAILDYCLLLRSVERGRTTISAGFRGKAGKDGAPAPRGYFEYVMASFKPDNIRKDLVMLFGLMESVVETERPRPEPTLAPPLPDTSGPHLVQRYRQIPTLPPPWDRLVAEACERADDIVTTARDSRSAMPAKRGDEKRFVDRWRAHARETGNAPILFSDAFLWATEIKGRRLDSPMWRSHNPVSNWLKSYGRKLGKPGTRTPWVFREAELETTGTRGDVTWDTDVRDAARPRPRACPPTG